MKRVHPDSESSVSSAAAILEDNEGPEPQEPSAIAQDLRDLQSTILRLAQERERLPQPLFWSLFASRLKGIKKTKELERLLSALDVGDLP